MSKNLIHATDALIRAQSSVSRLNYPQIFAGFMAKGISESDIRPRENIFTYSAWVALGRQVRRGEHGVKVLTWIVCQKKTGEGDDATRATVKRRKLTTVFHISQTDPIN